MRDIIRQLRHSVILLVLVTLSFGIGEKTSLCIMPDGNAHLELNHSVCDPAGTGSAAGTPLAPHGDQLARQAPCLDIPLGDSASNHHSRGIVPLPAPAAVFQEPPLIPAQSADTFSRTLSAAPSRQLLSLRSIVLLI
jgi:hypothetical protein